MTIQHQPIIVPVPEKGQHMLLEDYPIWVNGIWITVPGYFLFDASIPMIGWMITYTPHDPVVNLPAMVHDWLWYNHQVSFDESNLIFYELLLQNGANPAKAWAMYQAVSKFGRSRWENGPEDVAYLKELYCMCRKSPRFEEYRFPVELIAAA